MKILNREPVLFFGVVQALVILVASFGVGITTEQAGAIELVTLAVLSLIARRKVSPTGE